MQPLNEGLTAVMKNLKEYLIQFVGLKIGKHQFEYQIDKTFFDRFNFDEFEDYNVNVSVVLEKKQTMLELVFKHKGTVFLPCDMTNEMFHQEIKGDLKLVVQFGENFNNDNEELLILPHGEHQIDVSQYIYEMIVLSVPNKRVHPGVKDGTLQTEALEKLEILAVTNKKKEIKSEEKKEDTDPRWDKLKQLLTDK